VLLKNPTLRLSTAHLLPPVSVAVSVPVPRCARNSRSRYKSSCSIEAIARGDPVAVHHLLNGADGFVQFALVEPPTSPICSESHATPHAPFRYGAYRHGRVSIGRDLVQVVQCAFHGRPAIAAVVAVSPVVAISPVVPIIPVSPARKRLPRKEKRLIQSPFLPAPRSWLASRCETRPLAAQGTD